MNQATRILVVDDEPVVLELYAHILRNGDFEVWTAATGHAGLRCARERRPNVVLLDVMLPDMSGIEVCRQLKQDRNLPDIFVALCSGEAISSTHKVDGLDSGADDYIVKPVSPDELLARIRTLVRLRETTAALRASEQHFRRLVEILPDAVGLVDRQGRLRAANPQACTLLGYADEAEFCEHTIFDLTLPEDHARLQADTLNARHNHTARNIEYLLRKKNGTTVPVELSVAVASGAGDEPAGFVVVARETTARKQAEARRAAFSRLGKELSAAATSKEAAQIIVDIADELLGWDCCHVRLFSPGPDRIVPILAYDEVNGHRLEIPVGSLSQDPTPMTRYVMEHGAQLVNDSTPSECLALLTPFGETGRHSASRMFAPMRKGAIQFGIVSIQSYRLQAYTAEDLQLLQALADHCGGALERINFAESLRESEGRFRSLFESAPIGIALHDARGHYLSTNRAYEEMLGYTEEELKQLGVKGITFPEDITEGQQLFRELLQGRRNFYRREKRYLNRDGRVVWAESSASAVRDYYGELRFIISMVDDITERKQATAEIHRLNETLEQRVRERTSELETVNAALRDNEQQLRLTLEGSNAGTWAWEAVSNRSSWDSRYHELYGFGPGDPVSFESWIARVHPEDRARLLAQIEKLREPHADDIWNEEFRALHPVKGERWMAGIGRVTRDSAGQVVRMMGINLDITPRKRAEESVRQMNEVLEQRVRERTSELVAANTALRESEARFRQLAENITEVFWMTDPGKQQMLYISPAYAGIWGRTCEALLAAPQSWLDAVHPADRGRVREAAFTKQITGEFDEQYRVVRPDGSIRWIRDRAYPVRAEDGTVHRVVGVAEDITRRKLTEEALHESQVRKAAIMESALDAIITLDKAGRILEFNSAAEKMFGYNRTRLIGQEFGTAIVAPSLREWFGRGLAGQFTGEEGPVLGSQMEMNAVRGGGLLFPVEFTITRISVEGPPLFTAFMRDLTVRKRKETELARLAHAVESSSELICITDQQNRFIFVNRGFQEAFGYPEAEVLGKTCDLILGTGNSAALLPELLRQTHAGGWRGELLQRRKDGTEFPVALSTSLIKDQNGVVLGLMAVARDITESRRAAEQIRLLADAVQSTRELVSVTDQENRFTFVNQAFRDAYGYSDEEILGRTPEMLYSPSNPTGLCNDVYQHTLTGGWHGEIINCRKDGAEFPIALSTSRIKSSTGQTVGLVGVARDISERKRAEKQSTAFALLGYRLSSATSVEQAAEIIVDVASGLFGWDACYVHLLAPAGKQIMPILTMDTVDGQRQRVKPGRPVLDPSPLMRSVVKDGSKLINRAQEPRPKVELVRFGDTQRPSASMMYVPIHSSQQVIGVLSIQSYLPHAYTERDLQLLQILADHCGDALRRIEVTEALRLAEAKYRGIVETATEGIFQTTPDGRYLSANPAQARMLGYDSPDALVSNVTDIERQTYVLPQTRQELKHLLETKTAIKGFEVERVRKDGSKIWMSISGHVVRDASGAVRYYECTSQDITQRKLAEMELRQMSHHIIEAQEAERQRVARELHDGVNQIIASAKMRLHKVDERHTELSPATREILSRCEHLLVQALEENRRIAHNLRPTDLDNLGLEDACRNFCRELESRANLEVKCRLAQFATRLPPNLELNLFRIIQEAMNNVEKHARAKSVRLHLAFRDDALLLRIQDDGRGFDSETTKPAKKVRRGTGLANMRERAASVGGTCELVSVPKQGTTITVRVPWSKGG
jgi:PAS domain S-box-containing protein